MSRHILAVRLVLIDFIIISPYGEVKCSFCGIAHGVAESGRFVDTESVRTESFKLKCGIAYDIIQNYKDEIECKCRKDAFRSL